METIMETAVNEATETAQYLTFHLAEETYAMDVVQIREVLELLAITKIPRAPEFMRGVINVRGGAVPVIDMRLRFDMPAKESTVDTCIVVLELIIPVRVENCDSGVSAGINRLLCQTKTREPFK